MLCPMECVVDCMSCLAVFCGAHCAVAAGGMLCTCMEEGMRREWARGREWWFGVPHVVGSRIEKVLHRAHLVNRHAERLREIHAARGQRKAWRRVYE